MTLGLLERMAGTPRRWVLAAALAIGLAALAAAGLWQLRATAMAGEARELTLLSLALTDEVDRGLQGVQAGLQAMRSELQEGRLALDDANNARALQTRADLMPLIDTLWLADAAGHIVAASDTAPPPVMSLFVPSLDRLADTAMAISGPFIDARRHEEVIAVAVRRAGPPATGGGWILAAMPASALLGAFFVASPAPDARMAVIRDDGVRLAGTIAGALEVDPARLARRLANRAGIEVRLFRDGSRRLVAVHDLPRLGLKVVLTRNLDAVLLAWRRTAQLTAAGLALLLAVVAIAIHLVRRADQARDKARNALQVQRSRASKLEALGTLAGGVAHDFNNVLAAIVGFGEMAQDRAVPGSDQERHLAKVLQAALRGKSLVDRILAFSRGGARASTVFELEAIVKEVLGLLAASLRPGVVLQSALEAPGARLRGDPTQVFEAVMNIGTNAMQAMPAGGRLGVRLARARFHAPRVLSHSRLEPGDYLTLAVQDEGVGIGADVMEHLFEPFFTTRGAQSGTGLGLAVVHGVIAESGGAIDVQSAPGRGACFTLYFPENHDPVAASATRQHPVARGGGEALLFVDDDEALVTLATEMLTGLGYRPTGCTEPGQALRLLHEGKERYAALITDEVMPLMTGTQLARQVRAGHPQLPVLLVSGFGGAQLAARAREAGVTRLLAKPLQRAELAQALEELLQIAIQS